MKRFVGKSVLVSGAASGVGEAIARRFAQEGASVLLADLNGALAYDVALQICSGGGIAHAMVADVTQHEACIAMVARAVELFGRLDVAVNNAGAPSVPYSDFEDADALDWAKVIAVNLTAPFYAMKAQARAMRQNGGGAIVNIASMMSFLAQPGMASYIASKHGVAGLTKAAAMDLIRHNIRVNAVCPGFVDTPMLAPVLVNADQRKTLESMVPAGRIARADEVANAVLFAASDEASYMIGSLVRIDGGATLA